MVCLAGSHRSIPARAGEPLGLGKLVAIAEVYPRACGGTFPIGTSKTTGTGLSPRVRGNPLGQIERLDLSTVYPRACGGTLSWCEISLHPDGLSPRVRGNRFRGSPASPARATSLPVYPRACGGTALVSSWRSSGNGLSPRLRGNRRPGWRGHGRGRSIPAPAGEPGPDSIRSRGTGVYPRACGGTTTAAVAVFSPKGLSPRLRGNRHGLPPSALKAGSIPAPAGEPCPRNG